MTKPEDVCPRPDLLPPTPGEPLAPPLYTSAVYRCQDPTQADGLLAGSIEGYVYCRDGHPNADLLGEKCRELHGAERAVVCGSGMAALAAVLLALLKQGDHVVVSNRLYGKSERLWTDEAARLGIESTVVDTCDLSATARALRSTTRLILVETITNPLLRVSDIAALAELAHANDARLLVDNTFASPIVCRPLDFGADLVMESVTKIINGHSDVLLGLLCGRADVWDRVPGAVSTWGLSASPFDCWLAARGLATLALRAERADANARAVATWLDESGRTAGVHYPGLSHHPDHLVAQRQFGERFGAMVTFELAGGTDAAVRLIRAARQIPFSPSLGDLSTTLSHPESTSHRTLSAEQRQALGITGGTIRLSIGIESFDHIRAAIEEGLTGAGV